MRFLPLVIFLVLAAVMGVALSRGGAPKPPDVMVGQAVPAAPIEGLAAHHLRKGTAVVNFFASWCAPCALEQPLLSELRTQTGVTMLGVAYKDKTEDTVAWLEEHGNPFTVVGRDPQGAAAIDWGVYGVPETFVVVDGVIVYRHVGPLDAQTMAREMLPFLITARDAR